jgi:hypothetical protein
MMDHRVVTALLEAIIPEVKEHSANLVTPIKGELEKLGVRLVELETRQPARGEKGEPGAAPTVEQVAEAVRTLHVEAIIRDALMAEAHKGGIDVLAPQDVAAEMSNATAMLAEPFTGRTAGAEKAFARPRSFRFERDAENRIVAAIEE